LFPASLSHNHKRKRAKIRVQRDKAAPVAHPLGLARHGPSAGQYGMNRVTLDSVAPQPWRNGGGTARDLMVWPPGAAADAWLLRVSVAAITRDGPFSAYPGIERWFAVVEGPGVVLGLPDAEHTLRTGDSPLRFDGEAAPACRLLDGPTEDLNFMVRRTAGRGTLLCAQPAQDGPAPGTWRGFFTAHATAMQAGTASLEVPAGTLLWADAADTDRWHWADHRLGLRAWWLHWEAR
jgi:environmental stress-induced protein Ves